MDFGVKLNLHVYKTVKDFYTSLSDMAVANVRTMKKNRGLYHVSARIYINFSSRTFSKILVILTAPAVGFQPLFKNT